MTALKTIAVFAAWAGLTAASATAQTTAPVTATPASPPEATEPAATATATPSLAAKTAAPAPAGPLRVAVPRMRASGVEETLADTLTDVIAVEAGRVEGVEAIGMSDIDAMLGIEQQKQLIGCDDVSCMAEIGGALGVRAIISSKLGIVGDTYLLTLRVIDTKTVKVLSSSQKTVEGRPDALIATLRSAVPEALEPLARERSTKPAVATTEPETTEDPVVYEPETADEGRGTGLAWPAIAIAALGGVGAVVSLGVVGAGWLQYLSTPAAVMGGTSYSPPGSSATVRLASNTELFGCVALGCSCATAGGGAVWQVGAWMFGGEE